MEIAFNGKRALVTGASQGIGREIVKRLTKSGAKVVALDRNQTLLESLKQELPSVEIICCDLSNWNATTEALSSIGPVELLVNNAGVVILKPITENEESDVELVFSVNTKAMIHVTQLVAKSLLERKVPGAVVNVSSQASQVGLLNHTLYCGSKGAVDAYTRAAALELGPYNVRVNCVNPTVVMTELGRTAWSDPKVARPMLEKIPLGRFGQVGEVVDAVLFLLSDRASMITGSCLPVDGGYLAV